jgi:hypothetical protein
MALRKVSTILQRSSHVADTRHTGDIICVVLGSDRPLVLRPLANNQFHFVGHCFVNEVRDARALLGPLPPLWDMHVLEHTDYEFRRVLKFFNTETKESVDEDPRLPPMDGWTRIPLDELGRDLTGDEPQICDFYQNASTGEIANSDPRLSVEELKARGVALETLAIV